MGWSASLTSDRYMAEKSALLLPRKVRPERRAVLYAHGAFGDGGNLLDGSARPGLQAHAQAWAEAGLVVLSGDFGGSETYGNDAELAAMETAWPWLQASGLCATDKVILAGTSMGMMSINRFAAAHPTWVAGMCAFIPGIDTEDIRTRDALSTRAGINTAWALPVGSYIGGTDQTPIPSRGLPLSNLAAVAGIPTHLWYSSADTVATSTAVDAYAAGRGNVTKHLVSSSLGHTDAVTAAIPTVETSSLLRSWS